MRIILVSTFKQRCGIATYSEALAQALKDLQHDVIVLAEHDGELSTTPSPKPIPYFRTWARGTFRGAQFASTIINAKVKTDVCHFQHEYGLFPNCDEFVIACKALRQADIRVYVTLHTVQAPPTRTPFIAKLLDTVHGVIVHTPAAAAQISIKPYSPIAVIPHGVHISQPVRGDNQPFLCPGFMSPSKGHEEILKGYARYVERYNGIGCQPLKIIGLCRDFLYGQQLEKLVYEMGLESYVTIINKYLDDAGLIQEVNTASAVVLGAKGPSSPYSASGQMAIAIGCSKPVIAKNVPIYNNTHAALYNNPEELGLLLNSAHRIDTSELDIIARARSWPNIAEKHISLYRKS